MSKKKTLTVDEAIELLRNKYEKAKQLKFVRNPLAYALYHVWKVVDGGG